MSTVIPHSELLKRAIAWISEEKARCELVDLPCLKRLLDEAGMRYNLSPMDAEFLRRFVIEEHEAAEKQV
jgi:hypothetical protein